MGPPRASPFPQDTPRSAADDAWAIVWAAARGAAQAAETGEVAAFGLADDGRLRAVGLGSAEAQVVWRPGAGWEPAVAADDPRKGMLELYLPICSAAAAMPITVGHVGQSLDGFIATQSGESHWITGDENIRHMHRLRALCDAVVVGAGTIAADDPQLTTRLVAGPSPIRVVIDRARRLHAGHRVFNDGAAETLYVCAQSMIAAGERHFGRAVIVGVAAAADGIDVKDLMQRLQARGCRRVFVEGGGVTVSTFLEANLLDRLHITIAAMLIGDWRPAIRFPPRLALGDSPRPPYRVFRMGGDVLFDCDVKGSASATRVPVDAPPPGITRII
jgi:riboflavin-specific deaminase-like protein